jgi:hypothetical protein
VNIWPRPFSTAVWIEKIGRDDWTNSLVSTDENAVGNFLIVVANNSNEIDASRLFCAELNQLVFFKLFINHQINPSIKWFLSLQYYRLHLVQRMQRSSAAEKNSIMPLLFDHIRCDLVPLLVFDQDLVEASRQKIQRKANTFLRYASRVNYLPRCIQY